MTREQLDELDLTDGDTHIIAYIDRLTAERDRLLESEQSLRCPQCDKLRLLLGECRAEMRGYREALKEGEG